MTRKFKTLGLCLGAVFAMSAVAATAAQAEKFTSFKYPAIVTGWQIGFPLPEIETTNMALECEVAVFSGGMSAASETLTLTSYYEGCLVGGLISATVNMNGCDYLFHVTGVKTASADVICPTTAGGVTDKIVITVPATGCEVQIPEQTGLSKVTVKNEGAGHMLMTLGINWLQYSQNAKCPGGVQSETTATFTGQITLWGSNGGIWMD